MIILLVWLIACCLFCAGAAATIAQSKGYNPYPWMLFGPLTILTIGFLPRVCDV